MHTRPTLGRSLLAASVGITLVSVFAGAGRQPGHDTHGHAPAPEGSLLRVPAAMDAEHTALHELMEAAAAAGGATGEAGREVKKHLVPHFEEENRVALPPLGLLSHLVEGGPTEAMRPAIAMGREVETHLARFIEEHGAIGRALDGLEKAAKAEGKTEHLTFVEHLRAHAHEEEVLLYPMTVVIGRYLEQALGEGPQGHAHTGPAAGADGASERIVLEDARRELEARPLPEGRAYGSVTLSEQGPVGVVLMRFERDAYVPDHAVPGVVIAHVLEGHLRITVGGQTHDLKTGQVLVMPPGAKHDVRAVESSRMLRTISRTAP